MYSRFTIGYTANCSIIFKFIHFISCQSWPSLSDEIYLKTSHSERRITINLHVSFVSCEMAGGWEFSWNIPVLITAQQLSSGKI